MSVKSVIEGLWEYLKECPMLADYTVGVNFCEDDIDSAGIVEDSTDTVKTYISGAALRALHASFFFGALSFSDIQRIETSSFLSDLRKWFKAASDSGSLPLLPEGCTAQEIYMDSAVPFEYGDDEKKCTYQMHLTLEFIEE